VRRPNCSTRKRHRFTKIASELPVHAKRAGDGVSGSIATAKSYDGIVDFLLLDSHREGDAQIGALGVTHDWNISRQIVEAVRTPVILAGGLGPDNVVDAILAVRPAGVDSKTRTDLVQHSRQRLEQGRGIQQGREGRGADVTSDARKLTSKNLSSLV